MLDQKKQIDQWGPIEAQVLYASFWFSPCAGRFAKKWGVWWPPILGIFKSRYLTFYWEREKMEREGIAAIEKWILPEAKRKKLWKIYKKSVYRLVADAKLTDRLRTQKWDKSVLKKLGEQWYQDALYMWGIALVPEIVNFSAPGYLRKQLEGRVPPEKLDQILEILLAPEKLSFHRISELKLFHLVSNTSKNRLPEKIRQYTKQWSWLDNGYHAVRPLAAEHFAKKIKGISRDQLRQKIREIEGYPTKVLKKKRQAIARWGLSKEISKIARALSFSIWWQDDRKAVFWKVLNYIEELKRHAGKTFSAAADDLKFYTAEDFHRLLTQGRKLTRHEITIRKGILAAYLNGRGSYKLITGVKAKKIFKKFSSDKKNTERSDTLLGTAVSLGQGRVRGTIHVIRALSELKNFKKDEILVTAMTSPNYVPALRLAKAVVTDIGGLMSHAAVVSRELGIPCIVGTKIATEVFKDGDIVEVDAKRGIVRRLGEEK